MAINFLYNVFDETRDVICYLISSFQGFLICEMLIFFQKPEIQNNSGYPKDDTVFNIHLYSWPIKRYFDNIRFSYSGIITFITKRKTQFKLKQ